MIFSLTVIIDISITEYGDFIIHIVIVENIIKTILPQTTQSTNTYSWRRDSRERKQLGHFTES